MKNNKKDYLGQIVELIATFLAFKATENNPMWISFFEDGRRKSVVRAILKLNLQNEDSVYHDIHRTYFSLLRAIAMVQLILGHKLNCDIIQSDNAFYIARRLEKLALSNKNFTSDIQEFSQQLEQILSLVTFEGIMMYLEVDLHTDFVEQGYFNPKDYMDFMEGDSDWGG